MTDKKFTDEEIIKALECCAIQGAKCRECPLIYAQGKCYTELKQHALSLINRQKAEIERLNKTLSEQFDSYENIRKKAKAEATKEFAERVRKELRLFLNNDTFLCRGECNIVDQIAKELTEGEQ